MIRYAEGDLLNERADALVNTVNELGVMGKGIALQFKESYPVSAKAYVDAAKAGKIKVGSVFVTEGIPLHGPRWIIHFPTKKHWRHASKLEWIHDGLKDLARVIRQLEIRSIALPPLGAGNGKLDWSDVKEAIEVELGELANVEVVVFEPTDTYYAGPKTAGVESLTPARALIVELVRRYSILGMDCSLLEVQKLAWFLLQAIRQDKLSDPLQLTFVAQRYGPYSDQLRHLLNAVDGSYIHSAKRIVDSKPFDPLWFDTTKQDELASYLGSEAAIEFRPALDSTERLIDGFESQFGMELLATVDWLLRERDCEPTIAAIRKGLESWPGPADSGERKQRLFDDRSIGLALERLSA